MKRGCAAAHGRGRRSAAPDGRLEDRPLGAPRRAGGRARALRRPPVRRPAAPRGGVAGWTSSSASTRSPPSARCSPPASGCRASRRRSSPSSRPSSLGRVWCGWICPLGTVLEWSRFKTARRLGPRMPPRLRSVKYVLLGVIAVMAAFGSLTLMVLDPISLLTRTATTSLVPAFVYAVDSVERTLIGWGLGGGVVDWLEATLRGQGAALLPAALLPGRGALPAVPRRRAAQRPRRPLLVPVPLPAGGAARAPGQGPGAAPARRRRVHRLRGLRAVVPAGRDRAGEPATRGRDAAVRRRHLRVHHVPGLLRRLPGEGGDDAGHGPAAGAVGGVRSRPP